MSGDNIIFVGLTHAQSEGRFMTEQSSAEFSTSIVPELKEDRFDRDKTVLIMEGKGVLGGFFPIDKHAWILDHFPKGTKDAIGWVIIADYRPKKMNFAQMFRKDFDCVNHNYDAEPMEVAEFLNAPFQLKQKCVSKMFYSNAKEFAEANLTFELFYVQLANHFAQKGYRVVLGMGSLHVLRIVTLMADFPHDYLFTDDFRVTALSSRRYMVVEKLGFDKRFHSKLYDWRNFTFSPENLPHQYASVLTSTMLNFQDNLIKPDFRDRFFEEVTVLVFNADAIQMNGQTLQTGDPFYLELKTGQIIEARYLGPEGSIYGNTLSNLNAVIEGVPHKFSMPAFYVVIRKNDSGFRIEDIESLSLSRPEKN